MRYLLCSIVLFCTPLMLTAQSWNVAATGGIVLNTKTSRPARNAYVAGPGGVAGLQISYTKNHWEAGLGAAFRRYAVLYDGYYIFEDDFDPLTGTGTPRHLRFLEKHPAVAVTPFINRHFGQGHTDWYAGISSGYALMLEQYRKPEEWIGEIKIPATGFTAGAHAGCIYPIAGKWYLRGEVAVDGLWLKAFSLQDAIATAGIQYRIR